MFFGVIWFLAEGRELRADLGIKGCARIPRLTVSIVNIRLSTAKCP